MNMISATFFIFSLLPGLLAEGAQVVEINEFIKIAEAQNLDLKVSQSELMLQQGESQSYSLMPPMLSLTQMRQGAMSASGFEVSQTLPNPFTLWNLGSKRDYLLKSQNEAFLASKKEILSLAKKIYYQLWIAQERLELLQVKRRILVDHIKLVRTSARSDSFAKIHLLKAESDLDLMDNQILEFEQNLLQSQLVANVFLNQDLNKKIKAKAPPLTPLPQEVTEDSYQLKKIQYQLESQKEELDIARSSWFPDLSLKYKEMGAMGSNSKTTELMVGVSLPFLFFWEADSRTQVASAKRKMTEHLYQKEKNRISQEKQFLLSKAQALRSQMRQIEDKLLPRAKQRMTIARNLSPRDMETLQDHRDTMDVFPDLKMKLLDIRWEYESTLSDIEKYQIEDPS